MRQWQTQNAVVTMVVLGLVERKCEAKCLKCFVETARQRFETLVEKEVKKSLLLYSSVSHSVTCGVCAQLQRSQKMLTAGG